jgi:hypothetical protein
MGCSCTEIYLTEIFSGARRQDTWGFLYKECDLPRETAASVNHHRNKRLVNWKKGLRGHSVMLPVTSNEVTGVYLLWDISYISYGTACITVK